MAMLTGSKLVDNIDAYQGKTGELAFWWLGQLGFVLRMGSLTLYLDPYLEANPSRRIPPLLEASQIVHADYVFGSHDHGDHIDHSVWPTIYQSSPKTRFVVPALLLTGLAETLAIPLENFIGLDDGLVFDGPGIRITGIAAAHEFLDTDPATGWHPSLGYLVESNGCRIYHAGDTCKYDGLEGKLMRFPKIDVMFVPINGRDALRYRTGCIGNMDFREAVDLAGMVAPRLSVPAHYEMFANNSENPLYFAEYLEAKYPELDFWIGAHGSRVVLAAGP